MRIVCLGGGPAGLYFAISMKLRDANHQVTVIERNKPDDTFSWGVVLSDEILINLNDSATDWIGKEGVTAENAVQIANAFWQAGADLINVSTGQTSVDAQPVYGRMFQSPFSDRIRNDAGIKIMAVGNIYEADHANSILMAGRADLIAVGRPHLAQADWPLPYLAGRYQLWRLADREVEVLKA